MKRLLFARPSESFDKDVGIAPNGFRFECDYCFIA